MIIQDEKRIIVHRFNGSGFKVKCYNIGGRPAHLVKERGLSVLLRDLLPGLERVKGRFDPFKKGRY